MTMLSNQTSPCSARFIKPLSQRTSFDGIWLLSLFTYKYITDTCFNILRCQKVEGGDEGEFVSSYLWLVSFKIPVTISLSFAVTALLL